MATEKKKRGTQEADFLAEWRMDWEKNLPDAYWQKIPDVGGGIMKFSVKRPFDAFASAGDKFFTVEAKYSPDEELLLAKVKPHQWQHLIRSTRGRFRAYIVVCYLHEGKVTVARFFRAETALFIANSGIKKLPNDRAVLTVYRISGHWQITPQHLAQL